ncbi:hypothetical protein E3T61_18415 [Cryobacterium lactosi]|uniref:Uncharacterized protein n=1 Tax=Cryobacterium lactosi TaxID=1259202 RepID=A0A4R9BHS5_9MICO|nr:hypothetical protein [Cryobacterium lactosi]TFD84995.1 hypothetical protein E3T61_18415 [Cryobacterium lactosi]
MKANPYSTALFAIGPIGLVLSVMLFLASGSMGLSGLGMSAFAAGLFILGSLSTVGWLLLGGLQWKPTEQPAKIAGAMPPARHWLDRKTP